MSATSQEALAIVREFNEKLLGEATFPDAVALMHDDVVVHEPPGLPYGGEYHGPSGFIELVTRLTGALTPSRVGDLEFLEASECVVMRAVGRFTSTASGDSATTSVTELYTVRDGKIIDIDVFYKDPAAIAALVAS